MKLAAFRIKNFRSMIDSQVIYLSKDNITALIGQNESGKTTVLEALHSFSTGVITEDVLRSDCSFPIISCYFEFPNNFLKDFLDLTKIPEGLQKKISKMTSIWLQRSWKNISTPVFQCSDEELVSFYRDVRESDQKRIEGIHNYIDKIHNETTELRAEINIIDKDNNELIKETDEALKRLNKAKKLLDKSKKPEVTQLYQHEHEAANKIYVQKKIDRDEIQKILKSKKEKLETYGENDALASRFLTIKKEYLDEQYAYDSCIEELEHYENLYIQAVNDNELKLLSNKVNSLKKDRLTIEPSLKVAKSNLDVIEHVAEKVLAGKNTRVAESEVKIELSKQKAIYTLEQIGEALYKHLPVFEFFEDFSSLLPNRIDLSDLFEQNIYTEGYKAVNNFLSISGLSSDFFKQDNDRILKQRIENLNGEITIDFHEFWSQKITDHNKIHLNFELEHYNNSIPEKSGKPYLEFWIKDNSERLYPKQRSRGVRWFLSFYLELKATAMNKQPKVLLIDEPGISLHAKAQHDVLKVFENLKNNLQVIYSTHSSQLIDKDKMYRILAVQRKDGDGLDCQSIILDSNTLNDANKDTMMPIYSVLSEQIISNKNLIKEKNLVVNDVATFYYLSAFAKLFNKCTNIHFIPSNGIQSIPLMTNLLTGWRTDFSVLLPDNDEGHSVYEELKNNYFINKTDLLSKKLVILEEENIVNLFSKFDFKKLILNKRVGIPESNSEYIEINNLAGNFLASQFAALTDNNQIKKDDLDEQSVNAITALLERIEESVLAELPA